jgi:hypothetical protein
MKPREGDHELFQAIQKWLAEQGGPPSLDLPPLPEPLPDLQLPPEPLPELPELPPMPEE